MRAIALENSPMAFVSWGTVFNGRDSRKRRASGVMTSLFARAAVS